MVITLKYDILVNKDNKLDENWIKSVILVDAKDAFNNKCLVEKKTYENFQKLKNYLRKEKNILIEIDSSFRSFKEQELLISEFNEKYGIEYCNKFVAKVGESEHHTGLAIDICLIINNKVVNENEELIKQREVFRTIHCALHKFGFILRYPEKKENITGYDYEPWHIRYVGEELASKLYLNNLTLEEYKKTIFE